MEIYQIKRNQLRKHVDKTYAEIDDVLSSENPDKEVVIELLKVLEEKGDRLFSIDENIEQALFNKKLSQEDVEKEFDSVENYREKITRCRSRCETLLREDNFIGRNENSSSHSSCGDKNKRKFRLPKLELKKFDGDVKNWLGFWGQFKKIDEDDEIDLDDKFQYLLQATEPRSSARELIESFPPAGNNYRKAIDQLKTRFAKDEFLIEVYVRELLNLVLKQATNNKSGMSLATLYDKLETQLRALETLGVTQDKYAAMLFPLVESALPEDLLKVWERHRNTPKNQNIQGIKKVDMENNYYLSLLLEFLRGEVESEERIQLAKTSFRKDNEQNKQVKNKEKYQHDSPEMYTAAALYSTSSKEGSKSKKFPICIFCDKSHASQDCLKAQNLSLEDRKKRINEKKACFACLKQGHGVKFCRNFIRCLICTRKHYPLLCPDLPVKSCQSYTNEENERKVEQSLTSNNSSQILLQTIIIQLFNNDKKKVIRALLDSGSQRSYISTNCAKELGFKKISEENIIQGVFGGHQSAPKIHNIYDINIQSLNNQFECKLSVLDQTRICNFIPKLEDVSIISNLNSKGIFITDSCIDAPFEIELLLGADIFGKLLTGKTEYIDNGLVAIETHLGWTIMGKYYKNNNNSHIFSGFTDFSIPDLWELDRIGINEPANTGEKGIFGEHIMKFFRNTTIFNKENRYEVNLPWIEGHPVLENNFDIAHKRLLSTTHKLESIGKFGAYQNVLLEWEQLGIIEEVEENSNNSSVIYLPHHAVIKENSSTTKIRPVFDASCRDVKGVCLNSCLEKGPNLIELIPSLLLKFRMGMLGVTADIEKAFLQISVNSNDRDYLRFLWWNNLVSHELKFYRHCRVVFGVKSSPFLLAATLGLHLDRAPDEFRKTADKLKSSFYVDNCITSLRSKSELDNFITQSKDLLSLANFNLREWRYNSVENEYIVNYPESCEKVVSVLGLHWDYDLDTLHCDIGTTDDLNKVPRTKRGLLSIAQKVFDPIGFTSPTTLIPKLLLQETWKLKIDWDSTLPDGIVRSFNKWLKDLPFLSLCKISRPFYRFCNLQDTENSSIHVFCDASMLSYACCIFLRTEKNGIPTVTLIQAKSRVAPKKITVPRLELLATLIGVRLCRMVKNVDEFHNMETHYWSDSMVALAWIKTKENWNTFVGNRVKEIRSCSQLSEWHHIPGDLNPADIVSRGCNSKILFEKQWWRGPDWLIKEQDSWPRSEIFGNEEEVNKEKRKSVVSNLVFEELCSTREFNYFSNYYKIIRMIAWILRFHFNCKGNVKNSGELESDEIFRAENYLLKMVQQENFGKNHISLKNIQVFQDEFGLIRLKTRLVMGEDNEEFKYPIVLPYKNETVRKLIEQYHIRNCHAGIQTTLILLRERFWILKGRKFVREVIKKCMKCRRFSSKFVDTPFAPLPIDRIQCNKVFSVTGIDLAGPLYLKGSCKVWIVLFTCAVYRAVHIELVNSLSTDAFLMSLRRFVSRRGRISVIYSDNGTNFIGASNLFKNINWNEIMNYSSSKQIKWYFNPPTASWWGGWWERIVRIVKELLRKNLGKALVTYEELETLLCDCEAVINSRPLTYLSEEQNDLVPLTPSMFISEQNSSETPDLDIIDKHHILKRLRYIQKLRETLRTRFRKEYLAELVNTGQRKSGNLKIGDIVLIGSDNTKRINWPLGKIQEIYPGRDNVCRVARVKTEKGELIRPFQRLYPLELSSEDDMKEIGKCMQSNQQEENSEGRSKMAVQGQSTEEAEREEKGHEKPEEAVFTRSGRRVKMPDRFKY